jgi:hypothetical protein
MSITCPVRSRVKLVKNVKIDRCLSGPGEIFVKKGGKIVPSDIIGEAKVPSSPIVFNLPKLLKVKKEKAPHLLLSSIGEKVAYGQPIARSQSLFWGRKTLIAPQNGVLVKFDEKRGFLTFQPEGRETEKLAALVWGKVTGVTKEEKVTITTSFLEITGVLGRGTVSGNLRVLKAKDEVVSHLEVEGKFGGEILVAGPILTKDTLKKAQVLEVAGFVTGGVHYRNFSDAEEDQLPVLVTEGFGKLPIGDDVWQVLEHFKGRAVFLRGEEKLLQVPLDEKEIKKEKHEKIKEKERGIAVGDLVRLTGEPGPIGTVGKVFKIGNKEQKLNSGLKAVLVGIKIKEGEVEVPVNNLEIIG